jgi:hypothetical protein
MESFNKEGSSSFLKKGSKKLLLMTAKTPASGGNRRTGVTLRTRGACAQGKWHIMRVGSVVPKFFATRPARHLSSARPAVIY